jgi:hypothetical protein
MKVTAPNDLQGRMISAARRARTASAALLAMTHCVEDIRLNPQAVQGIGDVLEELADELDAIELAYVHEGGAR